MKGFELWISISKGDSCYQQSGYLGPCSSQVWKVRQKNRVPTSQWRSQGQNFTDSLQENERQVQDSYMPCLLWNSFWLWWHLKGIIIYTVWIIRYQRTVCYVNVKYMKVMWRWRVINDITKIRAAETKRTCFTLLSHIRLLPKNVHVFFTLLILRWSRMLWTKYCIIFVPWILSRFVSNLDISISLAEHFKWCAQGLHTKIRGFCKLKKMFCFAFVAKK